jgi:hypothetical protein
MESSGSREEQVSIVELDSFKFCKWEEVEESFSPKSWDSVAGAGNSSAEWKTLSGFTEFLREDGRLASIKLVNFGRGSSTFDISTLSRGG